MSFVLAGVGLAAATTDIVMGANKKAAGKRLAAGNIRPMYNIPKQYYQNDNVAAANAETGLPESTVNFYNTQNQRGLSSGIDATLEAGGDVNNLSRLYDQFSQGLSSEAAQDAQMREGHINTFINANKDLAGQLTQQWALNKYDPFKDTAQEASALKAAGDNQIQSGIGTAESAAASYSNGQLYKNGDSAGKTMGQKKGLAPLSLGTPSTIAPTAVAPQGGGSIPSYTVPGSDAFTTPGGTAYLNSVSKTDANSTQLQQLISILNQGQAAA